MNHLMNITAKELKELLTPGTILSIVVVVVMFSALGTAMNGETEQEAAPKAMGIVFPEADLDNILADTGGMTVRQLFNSTYTMTYGNSVNPNDFITYLSTDSEESIVNAMDTMGLTYVVVIPEEFDDEFSATRDVSFTAKSYYTYTSAGLFGSISSAYGSAFISGMNAVLNQKIIVNEGSLNYNYITNPVLTTSHTAINGHIYDDVTPYEIYSTTMGQSMIVPIIVMIVIVMVGSVVISSMGSEKENKTLETLLTLPIRRTTIVSGKLLAAAIMGLVYGACYLGGMMMYSNGMMSGLSGSTVNLSDYGLSMNPVDWIILLVILFLAIFSALGICMILGAFTKNYKMAQSMTLPISGLALIPMFVFMFASWEGLPAIGKTVMFLIPFSHPMMAMNNLMFGNMMLVAEGIAYLVVFDILMIAITVKIYNSDILITGLQQSKWVSRFTKQKEGEQ